MEHCSRLTHAPHLSYLGRRPSLLVGASRGKPKAETPNKRGMVMGIVVYGTCWGLQVVGTMPMSIVRRQLQAQIMMNTVRKIRKY